MPQIEYDLFFREIGQGKPYSENHYWQLMHMANTLNLHDKIPPLRRAVVYYGRSIFRNFLIHAAKFQSLALCVAIFPGLQLLFSGYFIRSNK